MEGQMKEPMESESGRAKNAGSIVHTRRSVGFQLMFCTAHLR